MDLSSLGLDTLAANTGSMQATAAAPQRQTMLPGLDAASYTGAPAAQSTAGSPPLQELYPGMKGFFVPGQFTTKGNDAARTPRQLFVQVDDNGNEKDSYYFDPKGKFANVLDDANINDFLRDPDTFDPRNPSGFDQPIFKVLQQFKNNPDGLRDYARRTGFSIYKQETAR